MPVVSENRLDPNRRPLWPGQVEELYFDLDQVRTLCSPIRSLVFWSLDSYEAKSATDLCTEIGKTAQTVRYHLAALLKLDLIMPMGSRRRRSRTESLYVRKARRSFTVSDGSEEYNRCIVRSVKLETQKLARETAYFYGWREQDAESAVFGGYRQFHIRLSAERAQKLKDDLRDILFAASFDQVPAEEGGTEIHAFTMVVPTLFQTRSWAQEAGIPFRDLNRDGPIEVDEFEDL